jgi:hypothetical protein
VRILIACEFSAIVRDAFLSLGHDAWSCDILPTEGDPQFHIQADVTEVLSDNWDIMIAHPPCTYLANSGVRWLHTEDGRWNKMEESARFFHHLLNAPIPRIAVENPIMHRYGVNIVGEKQDQVIQPWMFGHVESKATGLWLRNLPLLQQTNNVYRQTMCLSSRSRDRVHHASPGPDRWKIRSRTLPGIASAMAEQWGRLDS